MKRVKSSLVQDCSASTTTWSNLPQELIELIFNKLTGNLNDIFSFARVCVSWLPIVERVVQQLFPKPFVLLRYDGHRCPYPKPIPGEEYRLLLLDTQTQKTHRIELPELQGTWFRSISHGWLLTTGCENPHEIKLLNPLTRGQIKLPQPWTKSNKVIKGLSTRNGCYRNFRVVMSSSPLNPSCIVLAIRPYSRRWLNYCRPGDKNWSRINYSGNPIRVSSMIFYNHEFYMIAEEDNVEPQPCIYHIRFFEASDPMIERFCLLPKVHVNSQCEFSYLAELTGDLCLVSRPNAKLIFQDCRIHKLELKGDDKKWVKLESLDGNVIYVDSYYSTTISGSNDNSSEMCQPNCVCLIDDVHRVNYESYSYLINLEDRYRLWFPFGIRYGATSPSNWFSFH